MGPSFFQTRMGQKFYESTAPRIADELARLNENLAALIELMRERGTTPPAAQAPASGAAPERG